MSKLIQPVKNIELLSPYL